MNTTDSEINALTIETEQEKNLRETLAALQGYVAAKDVTRVDRLKVAICGDRKSGKSNLVARTARKPLIVYDFDDRKESIAGQKDTTIKTLFDFHSTEPQACGKLETDIGMFEYLKSEGKLGFRSICLDSITYLRQYAENQMMRDVAGTLRHATIGIQKYQIAQGWDSINYVQRMLNELFRRIFALNIDVYCIFHTQPEKDKARSTKDTTVFTDKLTIEPQNLNHLLSMFNEVWRTYLDENQNFRLQVRPDYYFPAATALHNLETVEDQNIQKLLEKHNGSV